MPLLLVFRAEMAKIIAASNGRRKKAQVKTRPSLAGPIRKVAFRRVAGTWDAGEWELGNQGSPFQAGFGGVQYL